MTNLTFISSVILGTGGMWWDLELAIDFGKRMWRVVGWNSKLQVKLLAKNIKWEKSHGCWQGMIRSLRWPPLAFLPNVTIKDKGQSQRTTLGVSWSPYFFTGIPSSQIMLTFVHKKFFNFWWTYGGWLICKNNVPMDAWAIF